MYTTSATIHYLMERENLSLVVIRKMLNVRAGQITQFLNGSRPFGHSVYLDIIKHYPELEGNVDYADKPRSYYENPGVNTGSNDS